MPDRLRPVPLPAEAAGGAEVWSAALDGLAPGELERLAGVLDAEETARAARFRFERDRRRFTVARGLLRALLGHRLGVAPDTLRFGYGPRGKPTLEPGGHDGGLRFNLSHSGDRALFAVASGRAVGVDLENAERLGRSDLPGLARRIFSPASLERWRALPEAARVRAFLRAWTGKEAYLKATGEGLRDDLGAVEVAFAPDAPPGLLAAPPPETAGRWRLCEAPVGEGWVGTLVLEAGNRAGGFAPPELPPYRGGLR